ncbi:MULTISPECIES: iron uptake transporter deferrochelatase/peroxidase subunit [unclassified Exiguobacterium]|uniref:iron uptake transporter deferrochelatase/peroxidase subunit n=1 Tax=unclassified Exiguobacterium TaxID=2644629 RepID=UPI001BE5B2CD|nr:MULTISPECIES: iron uptake transporter deferrochelatase/peroxidase subunit [unclassified Exiguobacterium]
MTRPTLEAGMTRRDVLKVAGLTGLGAAFYASGVERFLPRALTAKASDQVPFYGTYQAGIMTPAQNHVQLVAFDVKTNRRDELIDLLKRWTRACARLSAGLSLGETDSAYIPPDDTGEAEGLSASHLTFTFGCGISLFEGDRFGIGHKRPALLRDLPTFDLDQLDEKWSGGDLIVQICADDQQVVFHALRNLTRIGRGVVKIRWTQAGFQRSKVADATGGTPRNLFGFKDGTGNPDVTKAATRENTLFYQWRDGSPWLTNGTFLVVRRIQMHLEVWDRTILKEQERTFGRERASGAPLGSKDEFASVTPTKRIARGEAELPADSHTAVAHGEGKVQLLRRSYSYQDGVDETTGALDAGLLFLSYQRSPEQFITIQERLATSDRMNEYITHRGSALFACFGGIQKGGYIGDALFA